MSESSAVHAAAAGEARAEQPAGPAGPPRLAAPRAPFMRVEDNLPQLKAARAELKRELKEATSAIKNAVNFALFRSYPDTGLG